VTYVMKTRLPYRKQIRKNYKAKFSIIKTSRDEIEKQLTRKRFKKVAIKIIKTKSSIKIKWNNLTRDEIEK